MKPHLVDTAYPFDAGGYHTHRKSLLGHFNLSHTRLTKRKWPISLSLSELCGSKRPQRLASIEEQTNSRKHYCDFLHPTIHCTHAKYINFKIKCCLDSTELMVMALPRLGGYTPTEECSIPEHTGPQLPVSQRYSLSTTW